MGSKKAVFTISLLLLLVVATGVYAVLMPAVFSRQYRDRVRVASRSLESSFRALDESTELPVIVDPGAPEATKKDNVEHISKLVSVNRQKLTSLKTANNSLAPLPYSNVLGQYRDTQIIHDHTRSFIGQSEDALDDYLVLVEYLKTFGIAVERVTSELNSFNMVNDINVYSGQSNEMQLIASRIRAAATLLDNPAVHSEMRDMNIAAIAAFNDAANGFDDLAYGLAVPADDLIYDAARRIEDSTSKIEKITGTTYDDSLDQSRTIRNIQDLREKLELVAGP